MYDKDFFDTKVTKAELERLALLSEECSEVIQAINKVIRHGYDSYSPSDPNKTPNRVLLEKEVGDVYNALQLCMDEDDFNEDSALDFAEEKVDKLNKYLHYNELKIN